MNDALNSKFRDAIIFAKIVHRDKALRIAGTNVQHLLRGQLGFVVLFAAWKRFRLRMDTRRLAACLASFVHGILAVALPRTWPEVQRVAAARGIAMVSNQQAWQQWSSIPKFIYHMGCSQRQMFAVKGQRKFAIPILIRTFQPWPAAIHTVLAMAALLNRAPQAFQKRQPGRDAVCMPMGIDESIPAGTAITILAVAALRIGTKVFQGFDQMTAGTRFLSAVAFHNVTSWITGASLWEVAGRR